jgi:PIN domain nuclease of toxin-antitoxin system
MVESVVDASTLLAIILGEPTSDLDNLLDRAVISAVNLAEVRTKLIDLGRLDLDVIGQKLLQLIRVEPFTEQQAMLAAALRTPTKPLGLPLGDRACLALAISLNTDVYTADKSWSQLNVGCKIHLIR